MKSRLLLLCGGLHNRRYWLFIGDEDAGDRGAIIYTVLDSCHRRGIDRCEYLQDVLNRIPTALDKHFDLLTPSGWAGACERQQKLDA